jgi:hypothetical protein
MSLPKLNTEIPSKMTEKLNPNFSKLVEKCSLKAILPFIMDKK